MIGVIRNSQRMKSDLTTSKLTLKVTDKVGNGKPAAATGAMRLLWKYIRIIARSTLLLRYMLISQGLLRGIAHNGIVSLFDYLLCLAFLCSFRPLSGIRYFCLSPHYVSAHSRRQKSSSQALQDLKLFQKKKTNNPTAFTGIMSQQPWSFDQWFAKLPAIDVSTLENDCKKCGICCEPYTTEDQPLRLCCSHILGSHCLKIWLGPSSEGGANSHTCP